MVRVVVVVREVGRLKPDYSVEFDLPEVPAVGAYLSIQRPDKPKPFGEDMIVRKVWWRLSHRETAGVVTGETKPGTVDEIVVECEPALGPYSSDDWRRILDGARDRGEEVEEFEVARFSVRESDLR